MGYWIYMQAFLDVALLMAVAALQFDRPRRGRPWGRGGASCPPPPAACRWPRGSAR
jgi:hypothetical protein